MRSFGSLSFACALLFTSLPALAQDRLEDALPEEALLEGDAPAAADVDEEASPRALDDVDEAAPADAAQQAEPPPVMRQVSAGVSGATGALTGALVGAGVAFAHAGLWTLAGGDMSGLTGLGFALLPVVGAAGGALFGVFPFVEPIGLGVTAGGAAAGAGLGALLGFAIGAGIAGPSGGRKVPGENSWSAIALTATALGAGVGAAIGGGAAAPWFVLPGPAAAE